MDGEWQAVEEIERQELAVGLGLALKQDEEPEAVFYDVWARLKEKL